jgi:hypothetical protein
LQSGVALGLKSRNIKPSLSLHKRNTYSQN